jgi:hypothetical protein
MASGLCCGLWAVSFGGGSYGAGKQAGSSSARPVPDLTVPRGLLLTQPACCVIVLSVMS